jgi:GNAT superfamily N-acetyltransferase
MEIELRPATPADEEWLFGLHEAAHRDLVEAAYGPWVAAEQEAFFQPLVDDHDVLVVAAERRDVGAVYFGERDGDTWLELIEVAPEHQGSGVGAAALKWVVGESRKQQRGTLLQVHRVNERARRLYEREGFTVCGETLTHHLLRHD